MEEAKLIDLWLKEEDFILEQVKKYANFPNDCRDYCRGNYHEKNTWADFFYISGPIRVFHMDVCKEIIMKTTFAGGVEFQSPVTFKI